MAEAVAEADQLYAGRGDLTKVRRGVVVLRQAQAADPTNYELAWRLAKFNYYVGANSSDSNERDKAFRDGIEAGKFAVKLQDGRAEGHFWVGANYGGSAEISALAGLTEIDDIKREMQTVIELDEGYEGGSAYMVLGQMYLEAPVLLGGDRQKALEYLEKGSRLAPGNVLLRLRLAEAYLKVDRKEDARKQLNALLSMKPDPDHLPEDNEAITQARRLQETLK
jgi:tetratricopeptide (TPR) repeat protein